MVIQYALAALSLFTAATTSHVAAGQYLTWEEVVERNLRDLNRQMICNYIQNSARNIRVIDSNASGSVAVVSARYDYRCSDSTSSDTVYMTFDSGTRICAAYAFYNKHCTLSGRELSGTP